MKCEELVRYLSDYIDNNLSESLRKEAEEHLATCHNCHLVLDTTRQAITLYKEKGKQGIPIARKSRLFEQLQNALNQRPDCPNDPEGL